MLIPKEINGQWFLGDQPIGEPQIVSDEEKEQYIQSQLGRVGPNPAPSTNDLPRM